MTDINTTNYSWPKPDVDASQGTWGAEVNTNFDSIDSEVKLREDEITATETVANAALAKAGGVMTGGADLLTSRAKRVDVGNVGTLALDLDLAQAFTATATATVTHTWSNLPTGGDFSVGVILKLINGGSQTITWDSSVKWAGGTVPTFTTSGTDIIAFVTFDEGTTWYANVVLDVK